MRTLASLFLLLMLCPALLTCNAAAAIGDGTPSKLLLQDNWNIQASTEVLACHFKPKQLKLALMIGSAPHESLLLQRGSRGKGAAAPFPCLPILPNLPPLRSGQFRLTIPNTVRLPSGIAVHFHRNTQELQPVDCAYRGVISVNANSIRSTSSRITRIAW
jgi:hypothetical protein